MLNAFTWFKIHTLLRYSCIAICLSGTVSIAQSNQKKVVFIIADGIPADVIEKVATPGIDAIAKEGKYMRAYVVEKKKVILKRLLFLLLVITVC